MRFKVIDTTIQKEVTAEDIACAGEEWTHGIVFCDVEGFAITENGRLMIVDECGGSCYCPLNRFKVIPLDDDEYSKQQQKAS